jgi:hypothetical protein
VDALAWDEAAGEFLVLLTETEAARQAEMMPATQWQSGQCSRVFRAMLGAPATQAWPVIRAHSMRRPAPAARPVWAEQQAEAE